jgi:hypothetical protein
MTRRVSLCPELQNEVTPEVTAERTQTASPGDRDSDFGVTNESDH